MDLIARIEGRPHLEVLADKLNSSVECILEDERDALAHFFNAYHADNRVEPLLEIALYYMNGKRWSTALIFIRHAIELPYPEKRALFVDRTAYERTRWVLLNDICQQLGITVKYQ